MKQIAFILLMISTGLNCAMAQKIRHASGTAQFKLEEDMSKEDLKDKLRHHAIINAIEREYGTYVTQEAFVEVDDGNTQFKIFGKTTIKGDWLKTTSEEFKEEMRKVKDGRKNRHELWLSVKVEGKVRAIENPEIDLEYFTTNCQKEVCRTSRFEDGESMYLHFQSPVDGFLSIYALEDESAFRLLPYQSMPVKYRNSVPIKADQEYVFFSPTAENDYFSDFSLHLIDELVLTTEDDQEYLKLFLVFSTENYVKPNLDMFEVEESSGYIIPSNLEASTLTNWLESNRMNNVNFHYRQMNLKIVK